MGMKKFRKFGFAVFAVAIAAMLGFGSVTSGGESLKDIYYAGGCFWGVEKYFSMINGVKDVTVGYANGNTENPSYEDVCYRNTGHAEAVHVKYDPKVVSLETLTRQFFKIIDPMSVNRQGNDVGGQYRSGIYYTDEADIPVIKSVIDEVQKGYNKPIATEFVPMKNYYLAEEYHQDYLVKNPGGYCHINFDSLKDIEQPKSSKYVKPSDAEIKKMLTDEQFYVTQKNGTERAFTGETWDNKERGIYVDIVTGEPLFLSSTKYDSGTGWPSFTKPATNDALVEHVDKGFFTVRTEVRSRIGNSHLGHVFDDGPKDAGGLRYCMNSAAMRFVPYEKMEEEGYGEFKNQL